MTSGRKGESKREEAFTEDTIDSTVVAVDTDMDMECPSFITDGDNIMASTDTAPGKMSLEEQNSDLRRQLSNTKSELEYWKYKAMALQKKHTPEKKKQKHSTVKSTTNSLRAAAQQNDGVWKRSLDGIWKIATPTKPFLKQKQSFGSKNPDSAGVSVELPNRCIESGLHHRRTSAENHPNQEFASKAQHLHASDSYDFNLEERNALIKAHASDQDENSTIDTNDSQEQTLLQSLADRGGWLVGLLVVQSLSSFILKSNEKLLQRHAVIVRFLTMLVGAGGNAGNQASVRVIRGLATGTVDDDNLRPYVLTEFRTGFFLSLLLGTAGCIRAAIFFTPFAETLAITASLFMIVIISVVFGTTLPLLMKTVGIDPAHSSTTIQGMSTMIGVQLKSGF